MDNTNNQNDDLVKKIKDFVQRVDELKKQEKMDLSSDQDLSIAIMNLLSIEEHFFFSGAKTSNSEYYDLIKEVREMRKDLLKKIVKESEPGSEKWCLPPKTVIFANPEPKTIDKVRENELVLTYDGKFSPVRRTFTRDYNDELVTITPYYGDTLWITPSHLVLCATDVREKQKDLWRKNFIQPKVVWKKAEELKDTDFLLFPRYKYEKKLEEIIIEYSWQNHSKVFSQTKKIKVDSVLMQLIGLYISEGSLSEGESYYKGHHKTRAALYFSFGKHEKELIEKTQLLFRQVFNIPLKISETKTTVDLVCLKRIIVKFFKQFGKRSTEKELPMWILQLPAEKLYPLVWGIIKGDGCEAKYAIDYFTSSEKLAYQLRILLFKIGIIHSLKKRENINGGKIGERKIVSTCSGFDIKFSGDAARILKKEVNLKYDSQRTSGNFGYVMADYVMIPIRRVGRVQYSGKVYNIQTETETYTTFTGIVHNCISKHLLAGSMRLMEVGTKQLGQDKKEEAYDLFSKAYQLYSLFWGLNMGLVKTDEIKKIDDEALNKHDTEKKGVVAKLGILVRKIIDCCIE